MPKKGIFSKLAGAAVGAVTLISLMQGSMQQAFAYPTNNQPENVETYIMEMGVGISESGTEVYTFSAENALISEGRMPAFTPFGISTTFKHEGKTYLVMDNFDNDPEIEFVRYAPETMEIAFLQGRAFNSMHRSVEIYSSPGDEKVVAEINPDYFGIFGIEPGSSRGLINYESLIGDAHPQYIDLDGLVLVEFSTPRRSEGVTIRDTTIYTVSTDNGGTELIPLSVVGKDTPLGLVMEIEIERDGQKELFYYLGRDAYVDADDIKIIPMGDVYFPAGGSYPLKNNSDNTLETVEIKDESVFQVFEKKGDNVMIEMEGNYYWLNFKQDDIIARWHFHMPETSENLIVGVLKEEPMDEASLNDEYCIIKDSLSVYLKPDAGSVAEMDAIIKGDVVKFGEIVESDIRNIWGKIVSVNSSEELRNLWIPLWYDGIRFAEGCSVHETRENEGYQLEYMVNNYIAEHPEINLKNGSIRFGSYEEALVVIATLSESEHDTIINSIPDGNERHRQYLRQWTAVMSTFYNRMNDQNHFGDTIETVVIPTQYWGISSYSDYWKYAQRILGSWQNMTVDYSYSNGTIVYELDLKKLTEIRAIFHLMKDGMIKDITENATFFANYNENMVLIDSVSLRAELNLYETVRIGRHVYLAIPGE